MLEKLLIEFFLIMTKDGQPWETHNAAENRYCPYCAKEEDRWHDQDEHYPDCAWQKLVNEIKSLLPS